MVIRRCCGHERSGLFCSECGKPLGDPLVTLLEHVKAHATQIRERHEYLSQEEDKFGDLNDRGKAQRLQREKAAKKWEAWQAALEDVLREDK